MQDGEADGVKDRVRSVEVVDEHDEETVVGQLVEVGRPRLLVLEEHMRHCHKHLVCVCVCVCADQQPSISESRITSAIVGLCYLLNR